jgi:hypothetical protein
MAKQYFLAVVNVDVTKHGKPEKTHRFLAMHEQHQARFSLALNQADQPLARRFQQPLFDDRLERR